MDWNDRATKYSVYAWLLVGGIACLVLWTLLWA
jgi:hypothetical protein